jgi:hypothetical protein
MYSLPATTGGAYTSVHQDGHGTVDSGHTCLKGNNEVVLLRGSMPENCKIKACSLIPGAPRDGSKVLYTLPHQEGEVQADGNRRLHWPTNATISAWEELK